MASTFSLGWCACREEGGVILLAGSFLLACHVKGKQHSACHGLTAWAGLMELPLGCGGQPGWDGAGPSSSSTCPCSSHFCLHGSNHNLTSSSFSPPTASQTWPLMGLMGRRWGVAGDEGGEGQAAPGVDQGGRGCIAEWGWATPNPGSSCVGFWGWTPSWTGRSVLYSIVQTENLVKRKWWEKPGGMGSEGGTNI